MGWLERDKGTLGIAQAWAIVGHPPETPWSTGGGKGATVPCLSHLIWTEKRGRQSQRAKSTKSLPTREFAAAKTLAFLWLGDRTRTVIPHRAVPSGPLYPALMPGTGSRAPPAMWWEAHTDDVGGPSPSIPAVPVPPAAPAAPAPDGRGKRRRVDGGVDSGVSYDGATSPCQTGVLAGPAAAPAAAPPRAGGEADDAVGTLRVLQWTAQERAALYRAVRRRGIGRCLREPETVRSVIPSRCMLDVLHVLCELGSAADSLRANDLADQEVGTVTRLDAVETGLMSPIVVTTAVGRSGNSGRGRDRRCGNFDIISIISHAFFIIRVVGHALQ